jgi:hypothetical protein
MAASAQIQLAEGGRFDQVTRLGTSGGPRSTNGERLMMTNDPC